MPPRHESKDRPVKSMRPSPLHRILATLPIWLCALSSPAYAAAPLTLDDYFEAALVRSEVVATQIELIKQAEERTQQARGALWPSVSGVATHTWQDPPTPTSPEHLRTSKLTATQPLFRGFREFAALRQTRALLGAQQYAERQARRQLFHDVAQNFFDVLALEQDLVNYREQIAQSLQRETELKSRVRIGRSRTGEVLTVQSRIETLRAQVEQLHGQLRAAREAFAFLSGLDADTPLNDTETLPETLEPIDTLLARLASRPDIQGAEQQLVAARESVAVARGTHLPTLDLNANRYFERDGTLEQSEWDVALSLNVPIFAGGSVQSKVREALSAETQADLGVSRVRREAERDIRATYQTAVFGYSRVEALTRSTAAARANYDAQRRDYALGLVTNLEVVQSLTEFQENQRALDRARYALKLDYLKLQIAAARRPDAADNTAP